jgi:UDP-N-acetylglucosamine 2-epimerase
MERVKPDIVMVQGDTTTALAGALVSYYQRRPVAHVEAGLRTYEREPFPEEKNRELIGRLARWHFAPTAQARRNLMREGIGEEGIHQVGNPVIDATLWTRECISRADFDLAEFAPPGLCRFLTHHKGKSTILITAHRRENWGRPIANIATAVARILAANPQVVAVWPVHPNPTVLEDIERGLEGLAPEVRARIELTEPLEYPAMITLLTRCHFTLTDSGGVQEEASALRVPVLIARDATERQELVDAGGAVIVGTEVDSLVARASALLCDRAAREAMQLAESPFGDGRSAQRIATILAAEPLRSAP